MTTPRKVLVVDDEEDVRILVTRLMRDMGYEVRSATDGDDALRAVDEWGPDVVVLDLMMPNVDGWHVLHEIAARRARPRVVVLTARDDHESFARAIREGATAYVVKPFRFHELIVTVQRALLPTAPAASDERRRDPRRVVMAQVKILSRDSAPIALGEILDLSENGMRIHLGIALEQGDRVTVALHLPGGGPPPRFQGEVQWVEPAARGFNHGLRLVDLAPTARAQINALLAR